MRLNFLSFGHSIPIYSHFKTNFTALKRLFHADAHANHVELFPAASRWIISYLAAVGYFHDLLIMIDESRFVIGLHQPCPFVVPSLFPSLEKRDKPSLT